MARVCFAQCILTASVECVWVHERAIRRVKTYNVHAFNVNVRKRDVNLSSVVVRLNVFVCVCVSVVIFFFYFIVARTICVVRSFVSV